MRVLVGCESSGRIRDAFRAKGHDAVSCDLLPTESPGPHLQCDVRDVLSDGWDLFICHPPCTYLSSSGLHWNYRVDGRWEKTEEAVQFAIDLWSAPIEHICMENPIGHLSSRIGDPTQIIQPYQFGHDASKATCLWLKNLPPLRIERDKYVSPRLVDGRPRWSNQTDSGQNRLGPSDDRWKKRSETYLGVALAMAEQWSDPSGYQLSFF